MNGVMMQYFHWYNRPEDRLWQDVARRAEELKKAGLTALWLPPAYKGIGGKDDVGYGVYDMYDLGEFDQRGSVATKYGSRAEYLQALAAMRRVGLNSYADTVLNHRMGGDRTEMAPATPYSQNDRIHPTGPLREVRTYTHFTFPGRARKHSSFEWHWWHFDAVDYDDLSHQPGQVYLFEGKNFDDYVAMEKGNFAYLMGCDLDFQHPEVREETLRWGKWYLDSTGVDGFRLDAIKHIAAWFFPAWLDALEKHAGRDLFVVGEYWVPDLGTLHWYLDCVGNRMSVFDVPLHFNFHYASRAGGNYDMRYILNNTLMKERPAQAVTFVDNHDSQPLQALESVVEPWFKPLAYALILLRAEGYPCLFYPDYYGTEYEDRARDGNIYKIVMPSHRRLLDIFLHLRRELAWGEQLDYFDHFNVIGWTRLGDSEHRRAMAVLLSDGPAGSKWMEVRRPHASFTDATGHMAQKIRANEFGWAEFFCPGGSVSVWVEDP